MFAMIEVGDLVSAIETAAAYPAALKRLREAWLQLLQTLYELGIPLPPTSDHLRKGLEREGYKLDYDTVFNKPTSVRVYGGSREARGFIELLPALVDYLHDVAKEAADAAMLADVITQALNDERVRSALAIRKLAK